MRKRQSKLSDDKSVTTQYIMSKTSLTPPKVFCVETLGKSGMSIHIM
jgi:hypothetical protein